MEKSLCTKVRPEMGQHADWEGLPESPIRASLITVLVMSPLHSLPHFSPSHLLYSATQVC